MSIVLMPFGFQTEVSDACLKHKKEIQNNSPPSENPRKTQPLARVFPYAQNPTVHLFSCIKRTESAGTREVPQYRQPRS